MLHKTAEILKVRWSEAVMLIGLFAGLSALAAQIKQEFLTMETIIDRLPFWSAFGLGLGQMILSILLGMLFAGFLRSAATEPLVPCQPLDLLRLGRPYFWKLFLPYIAFELVWTLLALLLIALVYLVLFQKLPSKQIPSWFLWLSQLFALTILIKPFLLMPSLVILKDCDIPAAVSEFRGLSLRKMPDLIKVIGPGLILLFTAFGLLFIIPFPRQFFWIRIGILSIVAGGVFLVFFLTAILEIGQQIKIDTRENQ